MNGKTWKGRKTNEKIFGTVGDERMRLDAGKNGRTSHDETPRKSGLIIERVMIDENRGAFLKLFSK